MSLVSAGFAAWRECREEYELALEVAYERAEEECRGAKKRWMAERDAEISGVAT